MRLRIDLAASVPKDVERPKLNEDAWASNAALTCFALSDGASESYDSQSWAKQLVTKYSDDPQFLPEWVDSAAADYSGRTEFGSLSWSQQAAFERGSFATLLGVELAKNGQELEVLAVGDSLACHMRDSEMVSTFPYTTAEEFDARPALLCTLGSKNSFLLDHDFFSQHLAKTWTIRPGDTILLVTDALGQWLLRELHRQPSALEVITSLTSVAALTDLVVKMRAEHRMRYDDSTMVRLSVESD